MDAAVADVVEERDALAARLAEEIENAATYKQERDEIFVNYETVAAQLTEAHRQNADLMAVIDKRDEALGFIPLDKGMDMMDELREAKARLAEAERALRDIRVHADAVTRHAIDAFLTPDSAAVGQDCQTLASLDSEDAARFRWLCDDHADKAVRHLRDSLLERMSVMSLSAVRAAIGIHLSNMPEQAKARNSHHE